MNFNDGQSAALHGILSNVLGEDLVRKSDTMLLEGPAGTGKTAVLGAILRKYRESNPRATNPQFNQWGKQLPGQLCVAAMSHKAKGQLANAMAQEGLDDHPVITCDQLLKARPQVCYQTRQKTTMRQQVHLDESYKFIVIDEVSMMSEQYYRWLLEWKHAYQTILFIGDRAQLPPVQDAALCGVFTECGETFQLTEVMRHDGCILDVCNKVRSYSVGYPKWTPACDARGEVRVITGEQEFLDKLYEAAEEDPDLKVVCHTNSNVHKINNAIHARRNPGVSLPFVKGEHIMSARAIEDPSKQHPLVPSSMDMVVVDCVAEKLDLGWDTQGSGRDQLAAYFKETGRIDLYNCHRVSALFNDTFVDFYVFNNHKGEEKKFKATQDHLKAIADDRSEDRDLRLVLNKFIVWRERHLASVHLSTAMTIHKSQGSSFERVWVYPDVPMKNTKDSNRLAYVACSRAKKQLTLCNRT